jgi:glutamine synthetase
MPMRYRLPTGTAFQAPELAKRATKRHARDGHVWPVAEQPGSSMDLHMSIVDEAGNTLFAGAGDNDTAMFGYFVGRLQKYLLESMPLFGPNLNSFSRIDQITARQPT